MADDLTVIPQENELPALSRLAAAVAGAHDVELALDGEPQSLPQTARVAIARVLIYLAHGSAVAINPVDDLLTTQEAADFLGVSRPHLVALLDREEIPYQRGGEKGSHRRVALRDILDYSHRMTVAPAPVAARAARTRVRA
jgi:excisionase family DNA binding protein